tara:strand:+ start:7126 stop:14862 length:7737 start_codon:yes stop_codon:yes gene_type:complete
MEISMGTKYSSKTESKPGTIKNGAFRALGCIWIFILLIGMVTPLQAQFAGGDGSSDNPYQISTPTHLNNVRDYKDKYFILTANIDLDVSPFNSGDGWEPIGSYNSRFTGHINGNDFEISGLFINRSGQKEIGLIGATNNGSVENLTLLNVNITGYQNVGGLIGFSGNTVIKYVGVSGSITASDVVGGLAGMAWSGVVDKNYTSTTIQASGNYAGGLVGSLYSIDAHDNYARGSVTGDTRVGGAFGMISGTSTTRRNYSTGSVTGNNEVGGLIGYNGALVYSSFWDVQTSGQSTSNGGVGKNTSEMKSLSTYISESWNTDTVWGINSSNDGYPFLKERPPFNNGVGSESEPFEIATATHLNEVRNYSSNYFILVDNIDLSSMSNWEPIDNFSGNFDGDGYIISNLTINRPSENYVGLFGVVNGGVIENFGLENVSVVGGNYVGAAIGEASSGIKNVYSSGSVSAENHAGGLIGRLVKPSSSSSTVANSYSVATVSANNYSAGGLIGRFDDGWLQISYAAGSVSAASGTGGLVGEFNLPSDAVASAYWDRDKTGQTSSSGGGTGLSTVEMVKKESFQIWDFEETWNIKNRSSDGVFSYPYSRSLSSTSNPGEFSNSEPLALNVTINGSHREGESLRGSYDYYDPDGDSKESFSFQWYSYTDELGSDKTAIPNANTISFLVNSWDKNKYLSFEVTVGDIFGESGAVQSNIIAPEPPKPILGVFESGAGTDVNPYRIATADQLNEVKNYPGNYYILISDIDLDVVPYNQGNGWEPIGTAETPFTGNFDGNGYTINGVYINRSSVNIGFFGYTSNATVENVGLTNVDIFGSDFVGALVGFQYVQSAGSNTIRNSYATGSVESSHSETGGLVGRQQATSGTNTIENSYARIQVSGNFIAGGLVGRMASSNLSSSNKIINSYSTGNVSSITYKGGFVGFRNTNYSGTNIIMASYWDSQTAGTNSSDGGSGRTSTEMKTKSTFTNVSWDFSDIWEINGAKNDGYPTLKKYTSSVHFAGTGTLLDPYQISTMEQLNEAREYLTGNFILTADINADIAPFNTGLGWTPIGSFQQPFRGTFDGNDFKIDGLFINNSTTDYMGLFGVIESASISNIGLINVDINGNLRTGALAGLQMSKSGSSTIANSYATGSLDGNTYVGGLVGEQRSEGGQNFIQNSFSKVNIVNSVYVGGLVGAQVADGGNNYIQLSYAAGSVEGIEAGGLVGRLENLSSGVNSISNSLWDVDISGQTGSLGGSGKSTSEMKTESTFSNHGWDLESRWAINSGVNNGYPYLQSDPVFAGGTGTPEDPFKIENGIQLNEIRNFLSSYFLLSNNIDISSFGYNFAEGWNPIGTSSAPFSGVLDGAGYVVIGLRVNRPTSSDIGLFGHVDNGTIKNVGLENVHVRGSDNTAALVGYLTNSSSISKTFVTGTVNGGTITGGLVAYALNSSSITNSYSIVSVTGGDATGGLIGYARNNVNIHTTYAVGALNGKESGNRLGGLVALARDGASVTQSYFDYETAEETSSEGGTGVNAENMKTESVFSDWDFTGIWAIEQSSTISYPYLREVESTEKPGIEQTYAGGIGTQPEPFQVANASQLHRVRLNSSSYFIQTSDISLESITNWDPIDSFSGEFNGNGFAITNLTINRSDENNIGLFGESSGTLKRIGLQNVSVSGSDYTGGLVGFVNDGTISESYVSGLILGGTATGGLVGQLLEASISNSYSIADVDGGAENYIGGLVGFNNGGSVDHSYSTGQVSGSGTRVLGLIGYSSSGSSSHSFYDRETSGKNSSYGGTSKSTEEMKTQSTFADWDFSTIWAITSGPYISYPYLKNSEPIDKPGHSLLISLNGEGTLANPYQIETIEQLNSIRNLLTHHFVLVNDIDLDTEPYNTGQGWMPIGTNASNEEFSGSFDGNGFTIKNLYINRPSENFIGLFGSTFSAVLKNIALEDVNITGRNYSGGLVGLNYSEIRNSYTTGTVAGLNHSGGLVGALESVGGSSNGLVSNSYSTASVSSSTFGASALVGRLISGVIENSFGVGHVSAPSGNGGLVGEKVSGTTINSYWDKETTGQQNSNGGTGLTTAQMKQSSSFSGYNFETYWAHLDGIGYPFLRTFGYKKVGLFGNEGWRMMAVPTENTSFGTLLDTLWTQGYPGSDSPSSAPNVLIWNSKTQTWRAPTSSDEIPETGTGFILFVYEDDNGPDTEGVIGFPKIITNNESQFTGEASPSLSFSDSGNLSNDGWNLLGNPFGTSINWDSENGWNRSNLDETIYVWSESANGGSGAYLSWNGITGTLQDGKVAPWQGFWVKANADEPSISLNDSVKSTGANLFKQSTIPNLKFKLSGGEMYSSTVIMFHKEAQKSKDAYDAYKLQSLNEEHILLGTSFVNENSMDIQSLPFDGEVTELEVDIFGTNLNGVFTLKWKQNDIPENWQISLIDRLTDSELNLMDQDSIKFNLNQKAKLSTTKELALPSSPIKLATKSKSEQSRFSLRIKQNSDLTDESINELPATVELQQNYPNPFNPTTNIAFGLPENGKVFLEVFDVLGRKVTTLLSGENKTAGRHKVTFDAHNLASGMYIYRLQAGSTIITKKLTLIK